MPKLINNQGIALENPWYLLAEDLEINVVLAHPAEQIIVPVSLWLAHKAALIDCGKQVGVWLDSDAKADVIAADLDQLAMIALNFPVFTDGRSYSTAAVLRQHMGYKGDLCAIGDVLRDQLFYMKRCGFTHFLLKDSVKLVDAQSALADFADNYQATIEQAEPLFRRKVTN